MAEETKTLLEWAAQARVPADVQTQAARVVSDTLIAAVAGSDSEAGRLCRDVFGAYGGTAQATIVGSGDRTSAPVAAFVNAMSANAPDLDDNFYYYGHTAAGLVPAAVAMAEAENRTIAELARATAIGYDVASRVGLSMPAVHIGDDDRLRWSNPNSYSNVALGGVVATSLLAGLSAAELPHAFGIAAYSAPLSSLARSASVESWPSNKYGAFGSQAWAACTSAHLARAGLTGDTTVLDGPDGFWRMVGAERYDPEVLVADLGSRWWIMDTSIKLEAAGTWMRPALRAARIALGNNRLDPFDVAHIDVHTIPLRAKHMSRARAPTRPIDAQANYAYLVAVEIAKVPRGRWQDPDTFEDPEVRRLTAAVTLHADPEAAAELRRDLLSPPFRARGALTRVRIETRSGAVFEGVSKWGDGDPFDADTRITDEKLDQKFKDFAAPRLAPDALGVVRRARQATDMPARELVAAFVR